MHHYFKILVLGLAVALPFAACANKSEVVVVETIEMTSTSFGEVQGKVWVLDEIVSEGGTTIINRQKLEADGMGDAFTLIVDAERISGKAAPNRYFSPYTLGADQEISISPIAGTFMMSLVEPEGIQEREYFNYLEQVNQWLLSGDKLEFHTETPEGDPITLVYTCVEQ